jgi:hypothetical protein
MLSKLFSKTNPNNYFWVFFLLFLNPAIYLTYKYIIKNQPVDFLNFSLSFFSIFFSIILLNSTIRRLGLHKQHLFAIFFFTIFLFFIPKVFLTSDIAITLFLSTLAFYRLITVKNAKAAIFDFSFLVIFAAFFSFWSIFYIVIAVIYSMFFIRFNFINLFIPFVALLSMSIIVGAIDILFNQQFISNLILQNSFGFSLNYFSDANERIVFSMFISFILFIMLLYLFQSEHMQSNIKSLYHLFFILLICNFIIFFLNFNKQNESLVFFIVPISVFAGRYLENIKDRKNREFIVWVIVLTAFLLFGMSL